MDVNLVMFKASGKRKDVSLTEPTTLIGRGEDCGLQIPLLSVSRQHCEVSVADGRVQVKDLGSSNGTYVNNSRVDEVVLGAGDRLVIGPIIFTVQIDGEPKEIRPVKTPVEMLEEQGTSEIEAALDIGALIDSGEFEDDFDDENASDIFDAAVAAEIEGADSEPIAEGEDDLDPIAALEALTVEAEDEDDETP